MKNPHPKHATTTTSVNNNLVCCFAWSCGLLAHASPDGEKTLCWQNCVKIQLILGFNYAGWCYQCNSDFMWETFPVRTSTQHHNTLHKIKTLCRTQEENTLYNQPAILANQFLTPQKPGRLVHATNTPDCSTSNPAGTNTRNNRCLNIQHCRTQP